MALLAPGVLRPLNIAWFKFGLLLHKIVSPIVLGAMFFLALTPVGVARRLSKEEPSATKKAQRLNLLARAYL